MGLRTKIFLPIFLASVVLASYITAIWTPRWRSGMEAIYQESEKRHLESVAEGLIPFLLGNQLDGIYGTLDSLLKKNVNWVEIQLFDPSGRLLYPLVAGGHAKAHESHELRILTQEIQYLDSRLGKLDVKVDVTSQLGWIRQWSANLLTMLLVVALLFILSTVIVLEYLVRKPLRSLSDASKKLTDGDYAAPLPPPTNDEVGILINSFVAMRDAIGSHAQRLSTANEQLLQKIVERRQAEETLQLLTVELEAEVAERKTAQESLHEQTIQLESLNDTLEQRVRHRTAELNDKNIEVQHAYDDLKTAQVQLLQQDKLASIGQLAAGVAHEINNPLGYISSNLQALAEYFDQMAQFDRFRQETGVNELTPQTRAAIADSRILLEIDQILDDGADLINESLQGAKRVTKIVQDLKSFSRVDTVLENEPVDLISCMESALNVCYNELKYKAEVRKKFTPVPLVLCNIGHLNQVFLNLLVNAGQAITSPGEIILSSRHDDSFVYAQVSDTGCGIPEEVVKRIFDPFFTTKDVGTGTGLGLSISAEIIRQHRGELLVESEVGTGTTFTVKLPRSS